MRSTQLWKWWNTILRLFEHGFTVLYSFSCSAWLLLPGQDPSGHHIWLKLYIDVLDIDEESVLSICTALETSLDWTLVFEGKSDIVVQACNAKWPEFYFKIYKVSCTGLCQCVAQQLVSTGGSFMTLWSSALHIGICMQLIFHDASNVCTCWWQSCSLLIPPVKSLRGWGAHGTIVHVVLCYACCLYQLRLSLTETKRWLPLELQERITISLV